MPETTRQRRTAASILELIQHQLTDAKDELVRAQHASNVLQVQVNTLAGILADAERNNGEAE